MAKKSDTELTKILMAEVQRKVPASALDGDKELQELMGSGVQLTNAQASSRRS